MKKNYRVMQFCSWQRCHIKALRSRFFGPRRNHEHTTKHQAANTTITTTSSEERKEGREWGKDWGTHYTCHEFPFPKQMQIFKLHSRQSPPSAKSRSNRFWHGLPPSPPRPALHAHNTNPLPPHYHSFPGPSRPHFV